ncbi:MAG: hypothetical protein NTZ65_03245 [Candidatus Berkelbacteria bacterium]|nr:hypothetical protein [Candidatus Berkelbacteria bacterium]
MTIAEATQKNQPPSSPCIGPWCNRSAHLCRCSDGKLRRVCKCGASEEVDESQLDRVAHLLFAIATEK